MVVSEATKFKYNVFNGGVTLYEFSRKMENMGVMKILMSRNSSGSDSLSIKMDALPRFSNDFITPVLDNSIRSPFSE